MLRLKPIILLLAIAVRTSVSAASVTDTIAAQTLDNVVVTANADPTRVAAVVPVQTITAGQIENLGINGISDAVRRFAGTTVRDYGGVGGLKTVSVRNMGAAHTAVSYDGVTVSNCQGGQIDIGRFSIDNVSSLSLAVGQDNNPLQTARHYASASVLSINTLRPTFDNGRTTAFRTRVQTGSWGYVSPDLRWWQRYSKIVTSSVNASYTHADGNYPFTVENGTLTTRERRNNSAITTWHGEANVYADINPAQQLRVKGYWSWSRNGLPGAVTLYNPTSNETLWDRNAFAQACYTVRFNRQWRMQAVAKYTYGWNRYRDVNTKYADGFIVTDHRQDEYYLSATGAWQPSAYFTLALATDGAVNKLTSTQGGCPLPTRLSSITALSARWHRGMLNANAGVVATHISERVKMGEKPDDINRLAPTIALNLQPIRTQQLYVRALYKNTFRVPTFNDLYYDRLGNRALRPEKADEYSAGLTWSCPSGGVLDYLSITADAYYNKVTDKLVAFPTTYVWKMMNYGKVDITGIDLTVAAATTLSRNINLSVSAAYTCQRAVDVTDRESKTYRSQLPYTPRHSGNASLTVATPWATVGYTAVAVGKRYFLTQNIPANEIGGYVEQTLALSRDFNLRSCKLGLRAEILNLGNVNYEVIKYYPMPGRSWRLTASFTY